MFNFFDAIKKENSSLLGEYHKYNVVLVGGRLLYIEGHKGLLKMEEDIISLKIKGGVLTVKGDDLFLKSMTKDTIVIGGKVNDINLV